MSVSSPQVFAALTIALVAVSCREQPFWEKADWQPEVPAQRVVLGSVLAAETLLDVLPPERLVGVHAIAADDRYSLVADRAKQLPLLGASPEQLLSVEPDLVLVDAFTQSETLALLESANVPVIRTCDPHSFTDIEANLRLLGRVTHLQPQVADMIGAMRAKIAAVRDAGKDVRSWRLLSLDGALHTYGTGSLFDVMVRTAGASNLAAQHGVGSFRQLDVEEVLAWRPDAIVLSGSAPADGGLPEWIKQCPGLELLPCIRNRRILYVPARMLITTSHRLVEATEFVQRQLLVWGKP